jgi:hypothetical protein
MAYSSANSEVLAYTGFSTSYSSTTAPTLVQVGSIIDQVDGEINTALYGLGITSTPTNASILQLLAKYSAMGSAGLVLQRYGASDNDFRLGDWWYGKFESWMEKLITDDDYKNMIKEIGSVAGDYTGIFVSSNVEDGTHEGATPASTTISYGVEGFEI